MILYLTIEYAIAFIDLKLFLIVFKLDLGYLIVN